MVIARHRPSPLPVCVVVLPLNTLCSTHPLFLIPQVCFQYIQYILTNSFRRPACQSLVSGALNTTLTASGVADILDYDFISFGNAYYLQEDCPGYPSYDRSDGVACWQTKCGVTNPPDECWTGDLVCQHGADECELNAIETCAKSIAGEEFVKYSEFNYCVEGMFPPSEAEVEGCASKALLDMDAINSCVVDSSQLASLQKDEGYKTAQAMIPGTPTVVLNGEAMSNTNLLLRQVCAAFKDANPGEMVPAGCPAKFGNLRAVSQ